MADRVPIHRPIAMQQSRVGYERSAVRVADRKFYNSARWRRLRAAKLSASPLCEPCRASGRITKAVQVHHVEARKARPDLMLVMSNLQSVCIPCHNALRSDDEG